MLRNLTLAVAVVLVFTVSSGRADEPKPKADNEGIHTEVKGTLRFESGRGYFIAVKPDDKDQQDMRVWLWISENKILVRQLQGLEGKKVIAKGKLAQLPEGVRTSVPPLGMYMGGFEIKGVGAP